MEVLVLNAMQSGSYREKEISSRTDGREMESRRASIELAKNW